MFALHQACERGDVRRTRELLAAGANPDERDYLFRTPDEYAHRARRRGVVSAEECIYELERMNGKIKFATEQGCTPLHWACHDGNVARIEELVDEELAALNWRRLGALSPMEVACHAKKPESVRALLQAGVPCHTEGMSPLHAACLSGDVDCIRILLEAGAPINAFDNNFRTPLTTACIDGHVNAVSFLIEHGADVDAHEPGYVMALHAACQTGSLECVLLLLNEGVDTECHDDWESTPLICAVERYRLRYRRDVSSSIVRALVDAGADVNKVNRHGMAAFEIALRCGLQL